MTSLTVDPFLGFTIAIVLLFVGKAALMRSRTLRTYSIPEPVIGGFLCAACVAGVFVTLGVQVAFDLPVRDLLLLYFFASIGLRSDIRTLLSGGRPLVILTALATVYIILQNALGMSLAALFGLEPKTGLMAGSISLTGGVGTTVAWGPVFVERLGIANAVEIGVAANTVGLIAACVIGGPIARALIRRHDLRTGSRDDLDVGVGHARRHTPVDSYGVLWAWLWLNVTLILGYALGELLQAMSLTLPPFVTALMAGILLRNLCTLLPRVPEMTWADQEQGMALIADICLGLFLVMALMSLRLWELGDAVSLLAVAMLLQIVLAISFSYFVVFRCLGKDYEAAVMSAGFGGIALGSTATAIVNMTAVAKQYGAAHRAFIVVPLVCGFFIDLINALVIGVLVSR